ncbi:MAG: hypothetical protein J2P18_07510 [Nocardia sp.]|nr:hypothetical protein [Nocardia sp.]
MTTSSAMCACGGPVYGRGMCVTHYKSHRYRQIAYGRWQPLTDADAVRDRIAQIQAKGIRPRALAQIAGVDAETLRRITALPNARVTREVRDAVLAVPVPARAADIAPDNALVPICGARRRMQALVAFGYPRIELARQLGIATNSAPMDSLIGSSRDGKPPVGQSISAKRDRAVKELFDRLQFTPGPSDRAREHGRQKGWALPFEWDEDGIDDPHAEPVRARWEPRSERDERRERVADLTGRGWTVAQIAQALDTYPRAVQRDREWLRTHREPAAAQRDPEIEAMGELAVRARREISARRGAPTVRERTR